MDVSGYLRKKEGDSTTSLANDWAQLDGVYSKRLSHQLTIKLGDFVRDYVVVNWATVGPWVSKNRVITKRSNHDLTVLSFPRLTVIHLNL